MRKIDRLQFDAPPIHANVVTAEVALPLGMVVLSVHQWRRYIVVFIDVDTHPVLVPMTVGFFATGAGPTPHPTTYAGSVIMVDSQKEWHVYFGQVSPTKESNESAAQSSIQ